MSATTIPVVHEGFLHLYVVPDIASADLSQVTEAELAAGIDVTVGITADGFSPNVTENTVSTDMLTGFIKQSVGTEGIGFNLQVIREKDTNGAIWSYFDERGKNGYLVVCPFGPGEAGAHAEVYPIESGRRKWVAAGANAHQKFTVMIVGTDDYNDDAEVVAA
jgi:hypothetical protein